jgi:hypothetical protein
MVKAAEPPKPEVLGRVGADHFRAHFEGTFGIVEERFWYKHRFGTADGLPYMVEVAIAETKHDGANSSASIIQCHLAIRSRASNSPTKILRNMAFQDS